MRVCVCVFVCIHVCFNEKEKKNCRFLKDANEQKATLEQVTVHWSTCSALLSPQTHLMVMCGGTGYLT